MPQRAWVHHSRRIIGMALSGWEHAAFVVDDSGVAPKISDCCWPNEEGSTTENRVRLGLAVLCSSWVAGHLLRPWVRRLFKGGGTTSTPCPRAKGRPSFKGHPRKGGGPPPAEGLPCQ